MSNEQGFPAWELLELGRGARDNAPSARVRNLETGELLSVDPQLCLELGLPAEESYHCGHARGRYEGEQAAWLRSQVMGHSQNLLEELPFSITIAEESGIMVATTAPFVPGLKAEELIGANVCDILEARHHKRVLTRYEESVRSGRWFYERETLESDEGRFSFRAWCTRTRSGKVLVLTEKDATRIDAAAG